MASAISSSLTDTIRAAAPVDIKGGGHRFAHGQTISEGIGRGGFEDFSRFKG
jgi:hypothetical protein